MILLKKKVQTTISFSLNEHYFPPLSNFCQPIFSNVRESHLYQGKVASNVKHVSVHVSPVYACSVSEFVKPLNVSKPVCSNNATKRNVCNASSASQLIKPLNLSQRVSFSDTTKRNVCNASSVSQLVKPLNVCKTVCSSNPTEHNARKVSSISQLAKPSVASKHVYFDNAIERNVLNNSSLRQFVKTFNVTISVCSSNPSNPVICNCACNLVSNFVNDCQSVEPVRKLFDANRKRPHERFVNNKSIRQHDFTKPFSALNILMMSRYFYELIILFFIFHHSFCNNNVDNFFKGFARCNNFSTTVNILI